MFAVQFSTWQSKFAKHEGGLQGSTWNRTQWVSFPITPEHCESRINIWQMKKYRSISLKKKKASKPLGELFLSTLPPTQISFMFHYTQKQSYGSEIQQKQNRWRGGQQTLANCGDRPKYFNVQQDVGSVDVSHYLYGFGKNSACGQGTSIISC